MLHTALSAIYSSAAPSLRGRLRMPDIIHSIPTILAQSGSMTTVVRQAPLWTETVVMNPTTATGPLRR